MSANIIVFLIVVLVSIIVAILIIPTKKKGQSKKAGLKGNQQVTEPKKYIFILETATGKKIRFKDPFDNFLIYGGANSGKTKSIGKPILRNYIKSQFAGFIYDYKDFDLTKTANHLAKKYKYPYPVYNISFTDLSNSRRTNPIKPALIKDENLFIQLITDMFEAFSVSSKRDEWYNGALGIVKGTAYNFFRLYPDICTIPHIVNYLCSAGVDRLSSFLVQSHQSRVLASAFLDAKESKRTQASYFSSATNYLSTLSFNKNIAYVLTGNDFDFNMIDPAAPKLICVANSFQIESLISPIIALMLGVTTRQFTLLNNIPAFYFLDEATTFMIPDFEKLPSVLREYKCSFTFLTQSASKIEKLYGRHDRSSVESNFGNQFYGKTKDVEALKTYPLVFGKYDRKKTSRTSGSNSVGSSSSRTFSTQKEERYDTNFFTRLKAGEFLLSASNADTRELCTRFRMYNEEEEPVAKVNNVLPMDIENNYYRILNDIANI